MLYAIPYAAFIYCDLVLTVTGYETEVITAEL